MSTYESRRTEDFEAYLFNTKKTEPLEDMIHAVRHDCHHGGFRIVEASKEYIEACKVLREWILKHLSAFPKKLYYGFDNEGFAHVSARLFLGADEEYTIPEYLEIVLEESYGDKILKDIFPEGLKQYLKKEKRRSKC